MQLIELLKNIKPTAIIGKTEVDITDVDIDSRKVGKGHLFVAIKGTQVDGHKFIPTAVSQGASAVLCEVLPEDAENTVNGEGEQVTFVQVASTEDAIGKVATLFFGDPSKKVKLVGVTGTNGKTTVATLLIICSGRWDINAGCSVRSATILKTRPSLPHTPRPTRLN